MDSCVVSRRLHTRSTVDEWNQSAVEVFDLSPGDYSSLVFLIDRDNTNIHPLVEYAETTESAFLLEVELRLAE